MRPIFPLCSRDDAVCIIGLMSGTSLDGVDAVLARFSPEGRMNLLGHAFVPFEEELRASLFALAAGTDNEIDRMGDAGVKLVERYAASVDAVLLSSGLRREDVAAIGVHGQTIRHRPERGFTLQLNDPARLAELTGIDIVADFRSRDIAAGGEGAPLAPAFHADVFGRTAPSAVLNIGGISNITILSGNNADADQRVFGFDVGPGNMLIDLAARRLGLPCDKDGALALAGRVIEPLLDILMAEPFLSRRPPKSTGRELFSEAWLEAKLKLSGCFAQNPAFERSWGIDPNNLLATLTAYTARCIADAVRAHAPRTEALYVCGGGALNPTLMNEIRRALASEGLRTAVSTTDAFGIDPMQTEAAAFAWLARQFLLGLPGNLPAVTNAAGPRILGAYYPA